MNGGSHVLTMAKVLETVADSIAIELLNETTIITGKGNELHLFTKNHDTDNVVWQEQVLDTKLTNKIHGIHKNVEGDILLVYGEKEFVLMTCQKEFFRASLSDWISCGAFLTDGQQLILLTAHSIVLRFDYDVPTKSCALRERISCSDKSTLYCAHLYGSTWTDIVVFAGNAFGELLIWQPSRNEENVANTTKPRVSPLMHRITAHNGVIFSIDYDHDSRQLITTSDDRAVKWWRVMFPEGTSGWQHSNLQPVASGYGHVARVFKGRIVKDGPHIYTLSVGEDSYLCLWRNNGELLFKRRQQYGATIWNFVYNSNSRTIYTVGSIGNLVAYDLSNVLQQETQQSQEHTLLPVVSQLNPAEYIAKVKFVTECEIVGITNENRLMRLPYRRGTEMVCQTGEVSQWECVDIGLNFKCTVMEAYENRIAICGFKRMLLIEWKENSQTFETILDQDLLHGVIRTFVFFSRENFIVCDDKGNCLLYMGSQNTERSLELPKCKEPWLTTALLLNQDQYLLISNRLGNLLLFKLADDQSRYDLCDTIKHPHGNLGATELQLLNEKSHETLVRSSGHDGAINVFSINYEGASMKYCSREIVPVSWVENIHSWFKKQDLFLGFNDNHFVAWSREYDFLVQLACGGGHRCWHFTINPIDYRISLVFIKNKRVRFYRLPLINEGLTSLPPAKKWHISPCNVMQTIQDIANDTTIAISAGDDNLIKIHTLSKSGLEQRQELHSHISNVRALKVLSFNTKEFIIFSGGGRAQLCITKVDKDNFHVEELINYTLKQEPTNKSSQSKEEYNFDPETRLMSLDVKEMGNKEYHLFIGCSDGYIRSVSVNLSSLHIQTLSNFFYNKCILHIKYVPECNYVIAAGTDGRITFFDSTLTECIEKKVHHFSGVNSLSVKFDSRRKNLQILSGGDDQNVSYSEFDVKADIKLDNNFVTPSFHTAQVCATAICSNGLYGYTSGVDQMLYKFELTTGHLVQSFHSCVADIKGVCLLNDDLCLLYGCGLQIFDFTN